MKNIFFGVVVFSFIAGLSLQSCDKVENPYLPEFVDIDTTLLVGQTLSEYKANNWPTFTENSNTLVNVMIEEFTGHLCAPCPAAAVVAHDIKHDHEGRVFIAAIHAANNGVVLGSLQDYSFAPYNTNFTNENGLEVAVDLADLDADFFSNPAANTNRVRFNDHMFHPKTDWAAQTSTILTNNVLKVNLQAASNYFDESRGFILHTEVDLLVPSTADLYQVVYLIEDSLIAPQKIPGGENLTYVHKDIMRGCIDGKSWGRKLTDAMKVDKNGEVIEGDKYYLNYSYKLPAQYNPANMHVLIHVYDNATKEILQVIEHRVKE